MGGCALRGDKDAGHGDVARAGVGAIVQIEVSEHVRSRFAGVGGVGGLQCGQSRDADLVDRGRT